MPPQPNRTGQFCGTRAAVLTRRFEPGSSMASLDQGNVDYYNDYIELVAKHYAAVAAYETAHAKITAAKAGR